MVLSFMILWDLTAIRTGVASLRTSRLAPVYEEIAPSFAIFGTLFGKALQAQVIFPSCEYPLACCGLNCMCRAVVMLGCWWPRRCTPR